VISVAEPFCESVNAGSGDRADDSVSRTASIHQFFQHDRRIWRRSMGAMDA
jgi:hypothetical protein